MSILNCDDCCELNFTYIPYVFSHITQSWIQNESHFLFHTFHKMLLWLIIKLVALTKRKTKTPSAWDTTLTLEDKQIFQQMRNVVMYYICTSISHNWSRAYFHLFPILQNVMIRTNKQLILENKFTLSLNMNRKINIVTGQKQFIQHIYRGCNTVKKLFHIFTSFSSSVCCVHTEYFIHTNTKSAVHSLRFTSVITSSCTTKHRIVFLRENSAPIISKSTQDNVELFRCKTHTWIIFF